MGPVSTSHLVRVFCCVNGPLNGYSGKGERNPDGQCRYRRRACVDLPGVRIPTTGCWPVRGLFADTTGDACRAEIEYHFWCFVLQSSCLTRAATRLCAVGNSWSNFSRDR